MNKTAFSHITVNVDYPRPFFNFPDLSGPLGNPYHFFPLVIDEIRKNGFSLESKQLSELKYRKYDEHFNNIAWFLDLSPRENIVSEDKNFVYMKIKKNSVETKQIPWFHISDKKEIKEMINNGHDFSEKNIYGRTFFHYIKDVNLLEEMLNENKTHQWINLLDFDNFESHLLTSQQTVKAFNIVLKAFNEDYPELSEKIIFIKNNFNITPFNHINFLFKDDLRIEIESSLKDFADYLNLLQPNHQDIVSDYIEEFYKNPKFKALSKDKQNETKAQLLNFLLVKPAENNQNTKAFKI